MSLSDGIQALKCADCARSDSAATDAVPTGTLAIPTEAMLGFPDGDAARAAG